MTGRVTNEVPEVIYLVNARLPTEKAHGYQIAQMCQAFIEAGREVSLWHPRRKNTPDLTGVSLRDYYGLRCDIPRRELSVVDWHSKLGRFGKSASFIAHLLQSTAFYRAIRRELVADSGQILYLRDGDLACWLLKNQPTLGRQMIVELHSLPRRNWRRVSWAKQLRHAALVVALTHQMKQQLADLGLPEDRIHVAPDAVDWQTFNLPLDQTEARHRLGLPKNRRIASYVGKFHTNGMEKGIPEIIRAAGRLASENPDWDFYFVGGPLDRVPAYENIIRECGAPRNRFIFMEKQPVQQVPVWLKASDLLLMPHPNNEFYANHVSPLKLFEYLSARRPIIASRLPAIMEVLRDGENAVLAEPGNPASLARAMERVMRDAPLAEALAARAHSDGAAHTWANRARGILAEFEMAKP